jgi:glycosyltransferase involved in cell wall biosynthesis
MIDVIVPLYNKELKVTRCLKSIINQKYLPNMLIVIDDGSTDNSRTCAENVLSQYGGRYEIISTTNNGVSSARNLGSKIAESSYIAFLDADDFWDDSYLAHALEILSEHNDIGVLSFFHRVKKANRIFMPSQGVEKSFSGYLKNYSESARFGSPCNSSKVIIKRSLLKEIGGFPEGNGLTEDLYVWLRLSKIARFYISNRCLVTVDKGSDPSRPLRLDLEPYVLKFFLDVTNFISLNRSDIKYLRQVYFVQSFYAIRYGTRDESLKRISVGRRSFPYIAIFLDAVSYVFARLKI